MAKTKAPTYAEPKNDVYTGLLVISLIALLAGGTFLFLDWNSYSKSTAPKPTAVAPPRPPAGGAAGAGGAGGGAGGMMGG